MALIKSVTCDQYIPPKVIDRNLDNKYLLEVVDLFTKYSSGGSEKRIHVQFTNNRNSLRFVVEIPANCRLSHLRDHIWTGMHDKKEIIINRFEYCGDLPWQDTEWWEIKVNDCESIKAKDLESCWFGYLSRIKKNITEKQEKLQVDGNRILCELNREENKLNSPLTDKYKWVESLHGEP